MVCESFGYIYGPISEILERDALEAKDAVVAKEARKRQDVLANRRVRVEQLERHEAQRRKSAAKRARNQLEKSVKEMHVERNMARKRLAIWYN